MKELVIQVTLAILTLVLVFLVGLGWAAAIEAAHLKNLKKTPATVSTNLDNIEQSQTQGGEQW